MVQNSLMSAINLNTWERDNLCLVYLGGVWTRIAWEVMSSLHTSIVPNTTYTYYFTLAYQKISKFWKNAAEANSYVYYIILCQFIFFKICDHLKSIKKVVANDDNSVAAWMRSTGSAVCTQVFVEVNFWNIDTKSIIKQTITGYVIVAAYTF